MPEHNKEYSFYRISSEKSLYTVTATIINGNNGKSWDGRKFDFQIFHVILFKMFGFEQKF